MVLIKTYTKNITLANTASFRPLVGIMVLIYTISIT